VREIQYNNNNIHIEYLIVVARRKEFRNL